LVLANAAEGAYPVGGEVFKGCAWSDAVFGIAYCGVVLMPAYITNVLHNSCWFKVFLSKVYAKVIIIPNS
jgi:hypothetical protein